MSVPENNSDLPKVLVVSVVNWDDEGITHTEPDLFSFWDPSKVAVVYTRSSFPDTGSCNLFFQISENQVMKSVFSRRPVGKVVSNKQVRSAVEMKSEDEEKKLYSRKKKRSRFLVFAREVVWCLGKWKSSSLSSFVNDFAPDVYFFPIYPVVFMVKIQMWVLKICPRPYVCYMADDDYTFIPCGKNPFARLHRGMLRKQVVKLIDGCSEMFVITPLAARELQKDFGRSCVVLTKGLDYEKVGYQPADPHDPVKMVYTGKLGLGRASSLALISGMLEEINKEGIQITLDIYSPDVVENKVMRKLNARGCACHKAVPKTEVAKILSESDVVVFAESLEKKYRYAARLSFSTKLTDYMKSGKCVFAIGDSAIAPIVYLKENDAALIASNAEEVKAALNKIIDDQSVVAEYGKKAFECGRRNHDKKIIEKRFVETIQRSVQDKENGERLK